MLFYTCDGAGCVFSFILDVASAKSAGSDIIKLIDCISEIDASQKIGQHQ